MTRGGALGAARSAARRYIGFDTAVASLGAPLPHAPHQWWCVRGTPGLASVTACLARLADTAAHHCSVHPGARASRPDHHNRDGMHIRTASNISTRVLGHSGAATGVVLFHKPLPWLAWAATLCGVAGATGDAGEGCGRKGPGCQGAQGVIVGRGGTPPPNQVNMVGCGA